MLLSTWNVASVNEGLKFLFCLILINWDLNLSSCISWVGAISDSSALEQKASFSMPTPWEQKPRLSVHCCSFSGSSCVWHKVATQSPVRASTSRSKTQRKAVLSTALNNQTNKKVSMNRPKELEKPGCLERQSWQWKGTANWQAWSWTHNTCMLGVKSQGEKHPERESRGWQQPET